MTRTDALEQLLDQIAVSAETLANFAGYSAERDGPEATYCMSAMQAMAERIAASARLALDAPALNAGRELVGYDLAQALIGDGRPIARSAEHRS